MDTLTKLADKLAKLNIDELSLNLQLTLNKEIALALGWKCVNEVLWQHPSDEIKPLPLFTSSLDDIRKYILHTEADWIVASVNGHVGGTPYATVGDVTVCGATVELSFCSACLKFLGKFQSI